MQEEDFILLKEGESRIPVRMQDVVYLEACRAYTNIFIVNGTCSKQCGSICHWYEKVKDSGLFLRIDRSHLVNYNQILSFNGTGYVLLKDQHTTRLPLSHEGYLELLDFFD